MTQRKRSVFLISDRTGVTVEMLGHSLLTQFDQIKFERRTCPFVDTTEKVQAIVAEINQVAQEESERPLVFSTLVNPVHRKLLISANAKVLDLFKTFMDDLEAEFSLPANHTIGLSHGLADTEKYQCRIEAVNYSINHDDGITSHNLSRADLILLGVSRCGKTPTCLYLALQYGIRAANYPLIPEDLERMRLPDSLKPHRHKLYGLSIQPDRLAEIREERRPNSKYASISNCITEVEDAETLFKRERIPFINTTFKSIEEIASTIIHQSKLKRRVY